MLTIFGIGIAFLIIFKAITAISREGAEAGILPTGEEIQQKIADKLDDPNSGYNISVRQEKFVRFSGRGRNSVLFAKYITEHPEIKWYVFEGWNKHVFFYKTKESLAPDFYLFPHEAKFILEKSTVNNIPQEIKDLLLKSKIHY